MTTATRRAIFAGVLLPLHAGLAFAQAGPEGEPAPSAPMPAPAPGSASEPTPSAGGGPEAGVQATVPAPEGAPADEAARTEMARESLPSLYGPTGLFHMSTTDLGVPNHVRLGMRGEFFKSSDFLVNGDTDTRLQGGLVVGWTPMEYFEVFGGLFASNNRNQRTSEAGRTDPEVIKSLGDLVLGGKARLPLSSGMDLGFELGLKFLGSVSGLSFDPGSTSVWFGPLYSIDLRKLANAPLRFHLNANYLVDNSNSLQDWTGVGRLTKEVASFAWGVQRSRFRLAVGADAPLARMLPELPLQPFVEYHLEVVTADPDPVFDDFRAPKCQGGAMPIANAPPCKDNRDQQWVTLGLRARVFKGLTVDVGSDVAVRSAGFPYGPPIPKYNLIFGLAFPLDVDGMVETKLVTKTVEKVVKVETPAAAPPPPAEGAVAGVVKSSRGSQPVAAAVVAVVGRQRGRVATDPDGGFRIVALPPGPIDLEITAPGYEASKTGTTIIVGKQAELEVTLTPKTPSGNVRGRLTDDAGRGVEGSVKFLGIENFEAHSDPSGAFSAALPAGSYSVRAEANNYLNKESHVEVTAGQDSDASFVLRTRPAVAGVGVTGDGVVLKQAVAFKAKSADLEPRSLHLLDEVADALINHPELKKIRIEAHWDTSLPKPKVDELTTKQAAVIKDYLVKQGVADSRLEAAGLGTSKPLAPNIGAANKAKNRRVEFKSVN